jgi:twitching motility two-component system response regulator PilH
MPSDKKILLVDDSEEQVIFISRVLEDNGFEYKVARNGNEALEAIKKERPLLIILDIMMPGKSGLNVLQKLKQDEDLKSIPVIIASGATEATGINLTTGQKDESRKESDEVALRFGEIISAKLSDLKPNAVLEKPVNPDVLIAKIKELI